MMKVEYRTYGNPPVSPGLFVRPNHCWKRIAWWPAGYPVTQAAVEHVTLLYERSGRIIGRQEVKALIKEYVKEDIW